ncbi:MAG: arylsulfatase, partial [Acidobacteriota bacterium]
MVMHWPAGFEAKGEIRSQWHHVNDVAATVLEATKIPPSKSINGVKQKPLDGVSMLYAVKDKDAAERHTTQYFEMFGHRSIYHEGWKAVCPFPGPSFAEAAEQDRYFGGALTADVLADLDENGWELYDVREDPAENHDLAETQPDRLREMITLWYGEADRYGVLPLATADMARLKTERPTIAWPRERFVYQAGGDPIPFAATPRVYNRPHSITAEVEIPAAGAEGVLLAQGSRHAGYTFFVKDGHLHYVHNFVGKDWFRVSSPSVLTSGEVTLRYEFKPTGAPDPTLGRGTPGRGQLYVDGTLVASEQLPHTVPNMFGVIGLSCGRDGNDSVSPDDYAAPNDFTGSIKSVTIDLSGDLIVDSEAEMKRLLAQQ